MSSQPGGKVGVGLSSCLCRNQQLMPSNNHLRRNEGWVSQAFGNKVTTLLVGGFNRLEKY